MVSVIIRVLKPREECWSVNRMFVSKVKYILKYERHKNGFVFIVLDHG